MEARQRILVTIFIGLILVAGFFLVTEAITKLTGFSVGEKKDANDFKICLREKEITLYVNTNDISKTLGNIGVQNYLEDIKIINCLRDNQVCLEKNIDSFPSWIIEDNIIQGDISIEKISELSKCKLIE